MGIHYDSEYYPEPDVFNPERFDEEARRKIPQFAYLPFGDGPRNCFGIIQLRFVDLFLYQLFRSSIWSRAK